MTDLNIEPTFDFDSAKKRDASTVQGIDAQQYFDESDPGSSLSSPQKRIAALISFVNKNLYDIFDLANKTGGTAFLDPSLDMLEKMRTLLLTLMIQDHSRNIDYARNLSQTWHLIIEYFTPYILSRIQNISKSEAIKKFITEVKSYPTSTDHSLGYYLQKYAGENWLPFPFISLLKTLHDDNAKLGEKSQLNAWVLQLTDLVDYFSEIQPQKKK